MATSTLPTSNLSTPIANYLTGEGYTVRPLRTTEWLACNKQRCYLLDLQSDLFQVSDRDRGQTSESADLGVRLNTLERWRHEYLAIALELSAKDFRCRKFVECSDLKAWTVYSVHDPNLTEQLLWQGGVWSIAPEDRRCDEQTLEVEGIMQGALRAIAHTGGTHA